MGLSEDFDFSLLHICIDKLGEYYLLYKTVRWIPNYGTSGVF